MMKKGLGLSIFLLGVSVSLPSQAILPLPYSLDAVDETPQSWQEEFSPKDIQAYNDLYTASQLREMELPNFENAPGVLGYTAETFVVPPELKSRVEFWKKIYTQYTSTQALMHDSEYPEIVYSVVDISDLISDENVPYKKRARAVSKFLKAKKEALQAQLRQLQALSANPVEIPADLFPLFKKFEGNNDKDKFKSAANRVRAQVGQRDRIVQGFLYGGRYYAKMMEIFAHEKLPKELTRLTLVESAFNLSARSKVGASGVWQFMRSTGKLFLRINRAVDERNDPLAATWAATQLLKGNYDALGSWPLAVTAYNHGRGGMARAVRILATNDLPSIIKNYKAKTFGFASSNFFSEFLAVLEVEREYRKYFGKLLVDPPIQFEEYLVGDNVKLDAIADGCKVKKETIAALNPAFTDWVVSGKGLVPKGYSVKVPPESLAACKSNLKVGSFTDLTSPKKRS